MRTHLFVSSMLFIFTRTKQYLANAMVVQAHLWGRSHYHSNETRTNRNYNCRAYGWIKWKSIGWQTTETVSHCRSDRLCTHTHAKLSNSCHDTFPLNTNSLFICLWVLSVWFGRFVYCLFLFADGIIYGNLWSDFHFKCSSIRIEFKEEM